MLTPQPKTTDFDIAFAMNARREKPELLDRCLGCLRRSYPSSPVLVIYDGLDMPDRLPKPNEYLRAIDGRAFVLWDRCLKQGLGNGAAIWTRMLSAALRFRTKFIVKLDPDTLVHKRITLFPEDGIFCAGTMMSASHAAQHVQGGFQIFTRQLAQALMVESQREKYKDPASWDVGQAQVFISRDLVSTDYLLRAMMLNLRATMLNHPELDCRSLRGGEPFRQEASVTHPHKTIND